ncbi:Secreted protein containing N-terminal Zinc-dependent carboxypeptidase related domain [hydrothermal vent metagenome]|uniref:Secreted protein containing N-terminal Zinc-dependent carboxypeptidase related domain n=1 Tax=hydrothermal vent metagenome TaxID=652676 RepID=A0A160VEM6_9ZZZZ
MKQFLSIYLFTFLFGQQNIQLPMNIKGVRYNRSIPKPEEIIGHQIGTSHTRTDQVVDYFEALASRSNRIILNDHALTHEGRRLIHAIVTHPDNHENLETIREGNLKLSDKPNSMSDQDLNKMPLVAYLGFSIHGDEASGTEASLLLLYHLAAGSGKQIDDILKNTVLIIDPMFNPDGRDRFVNWVNGNRGRVPTSDTQDREHNQPWPRGRTNHYLFDMNRDWLPVTQPESNGRIKLFHHWRPQFLLDAHEMGSNSTFFFQPGISSRNNPNTPKGTLELANKLIPFHAKRLDSIQSMYYSQQSYDDFYYGKGSTFGDIHGSVGILFEQASSRALESETNQGRLVYAFTIRNHYMSTLGTLDGLVALRKDFLTYHRDFYATAPDAAKKNQVRGYLISLKQNRTRAQMLIQNLQKHRIVAHELKKSMTVKQTKFNPGEAVIIPSNQPQTRFLKGIMERMTTFEDSLFYDVSAWTLPLAYGVESYELKQNPNAYIGTQLGLVELDGGMLTGGKAKSAYLMKWDRYYAPKSLYSIMDLGIRPRLTTQAFSAVVDGKEVQFDRGTIVIPAYQRDADATITQEKIHKMMIHLAKMDHVNIYASNTASTPSGPDLGGAYQGVLQKPKVAILSGDGTSSYGVGEVWHLLNFRMGIPVSLLNAKQLSARKLSKYNTIIVPDGFYSNLDSTDIKTLKDWVLNGGTLIATQTGSRWVVNKKILNEKLKKGGMDTLDIPYEQAPMVTGAQRIGGSIFEVSLDNTHPIAYGYNKKTPMFRRGDTFFELSTSTAANVGRYTKNPLLSGYISEEKLKEIQNSASIIARRQGGGHVILFADNPSFRAFWYGSNGLLLNAVFFGQAF